MPTHSLVCGTEHFRCFRFQMLGRDSSDHCKSADGDRSTHHFSSVSGGPFFMLSIVPSEISCPLAPKIKNFYFIGFRLFHIDTCSKSLLAVVKIMFQVNPQIKFYFKQSPALKIPYLGFDVFFKVSMLESSWAWKPNLAQRRTLPLGCPDPQTHVPTTDHNGHITHHTYIHNITHTMTQNIPHIHITDHSLRSTCVRLSVGNTASPNSLPPPSPSPMVPSGWSLRSIICPPPSPFQGLGRAPTKYVSQQNRDGLPAPAGARRTGRHRWTPRG